MNVFEFLKFAPKIALVILPLALTLLVFAILSLFKKQKKGGQAVPDASSPLSPTPPPKTSPSSRRSILMILTILFLLLSLPLALLLVNQKQEIRMKAEVPEETLLPETNHPSCGGLDGSDFAKPGDIVSLTAQPSGDNLDSVEFWLISEANIEQYGSYCPTDQWAPDVWTMIDRDIDGNDGWSAKWNSTNYPEDRYFISVNVNSLYGEEKWWCTGNPEGPCNQDPQGKSCPDCSKWITLTTSEEATPTSTPSGELRIKIYDQNWIEIAYENLSQLTPEQTIKISVQGKEAGNFDKGRIRINNSEWTLENETTDHKPDSPGEFYVECQVDKTEGRATLCGIEATLEDEFKIEGEVHDAVIGEWR